MLTSSELARLRKRPLPAGRALVRYLVRYHDALLMLVAYPPDARTLAQAERELARIARWLKTHRTAREALRHGDGLPFVRSTTSYSHDCVRWLLQHPHCRVTMAGFADTTLTLNDVLRLTLPRPERAETNAGLANDELFDVLRVKARDRLPFLVAELSRLDATPFVKDQLFDALGIQVHVDPTDRAFSTAYNRLPVATPFFQTERLTRFDAAALLETALPTPRALSTAQRDDVVRVIRNTMALNTRETDPATYLDHRSLRVFDLERGVSVAIFGMTHDRQLAIESYLGFTAFKNGLPVSYGGAWMLGERADFGMNIFAPYRGGESGYLMCQLLRVYRQQFGLRYIEVDAHQFGLDNPEGIETGAFWFYYRYGFRPIDRALHALAVREKARLSKRAGARSTPAMLRRFTESNIALADGGRVPLSLYDITTRVTRLVATSYHSDRPAAERDSVQLLRQSLAGLASFDVASFDDATRDASTQDAMAELSLVARALKVRDDAGLRLIAELIVVKPQDPYRYQSLLTALLSSRARPTRRATAAS